VNQKDADMQKRKHVKVKLSGHTIEKNNEKAGYLAPLFLYYVL
jgi:hypothetical protein